MPTPYAEVRRSPRSVAAGRPGCRRQVQKDVNEGRLPGGRRAVRSRSRSLFRYAAFSNVRISGSIPEGRMCRSQLAKKQGVEKSKLLGPPASLDSVDIGPGSFSGKTHFLPGLKQRITPDGPPRGGMPSPYPDPPWPTAIPGSTLVLARLENDATETGGGSAAGFRQPVSSSPRPETHPDRSVWGRSPPGAPPGSDG